MRYVARRLLFSSSFLMFKLLNAHNYFVHALPQFSIFADFVDIIQASTFDKIILRTTFFFQRMWYVARLLLFLPVGAFGIIPHPWTVHHHRCQQMSQASVLDSTASYRVIGFYRRATISSPLMLLYLHYFKVCFYIYMGFYPTTDLCDNIQRDLETLSLFSYSPWHSPIPLSATLSLL